MATTIVVAGISATIVASRTQNPEPAAIEAAVSGFAHSRLPGPSTPSGPAPDLSALRLVEVGAGAGRLDELPVDAYAFRDPGGRRLMVYIGRRAFPMAQGARALAGADGPWIARSDGITVLCARYPHELLLVGKDETLVRAAAQALDIT